MNDGKRAPVARKVSALSMRRPSSIAGIDLIDGGQDDMLRSRPNPGHIAFIVENQRRPFPGCNGVGARDPDLRLLEIRLDIGSHSLPSHPQGRAEPSFPRCLERISAIS